MSVFKLSFLSAIIALFCLSSCETLESNIKQKPSDNNIYSFIDTLMKKWYLWNDEMPEVEYWSYDSPPELLKDMKVPQDKWSFVDLEQNNISYFREGEDFGFGFYLAWDSFNNLRVIIVYKNTDAYSAGIRRGWIVEEINEIDVDQISDFSLVFSRDPGSMVFKLLDENRTSHTIELSKDYFYLNAIFNASIYNVADKKTGYLSYQSFLGYSEKELLDTLAYFHSENIEELIVDLRYNSGGYNSITQKMSEIILPAGNEDNILYSLLHNNINSSENIDIPITSNELNLDLKRVFFITNHYSASASELIINSLEPYMEVLHIGDTTSGKPYAMYAFSYQGWIIYPVTAKTVNSLGYGEYNTGIVPDKLLPDDHSHNWGDSNDPAIQQAFNYIQYGSFGDIAMTSLKGTDRTIVKSIELPLNRGLFIIEKK